MSTAIEAHQMGARNMDDSGDRAILSRLDCEDIAAANALHWVDRYEANAEEVIADLRDMSDDALLAIDHQLGRVDRATWRLRCAIHAEVVHRLTSRHEFRGVHDIEGRQIARAVAEVAANADITPKTVYLNARIHLNFFANNAGVTRRLLESGSLDVLQDKTFFEAALEADDPFEAIEYFAEAKSSDRRFSTGDARRYVREGKAPALDGQPVNALDTDAQHEDYRTWIEATKRLQRSVPLWRGTLGGYLEEMEYEASRPSQTWRDRIEARLIQYQRATVQQLAKDLGLDRIHCEVMLRRMVEDGQLCSGPQERPKGARGAAQKEYWLNPEWDGEID